MDNTADILKTAIEKEIHAKTFYGQAAEITSEGESSMVFLELSGIEDGHAKLLVDRFGELLRGQGFDAAAYLAKLEQDLAASLNVEETELIKRGEMRAVLEFAIQMEANARDNYLDLAKKVTDPGHRTFCEDLAAEEQKHFDLLTKERLSVDMPLDERPAL